MGYLIKLDTNGTRPEVLINLTGKGLLDYAAMDIKAGRENYPLAAGIPGLDMEPIKESAAFLLNGELPYEFRTTVVKGIHTAQDFSDIALWLSGCRRYFLQNYRDSKQVLSPGFQSFSAEELLGFAARLKPVMGQVSLRGAGY